jgi:FKBP12-rapamycin complex-associated protein
MPGIQSPQDERVMQLFGLVNTLLSADPETFKRHLNITRYSVIPLSPKSGLIGWVPHCDTLHALIKDYRDSRKILLNIEHRIMLQACYGVMVVDPAYRSWSL